MVKVIYERAANFADLSEIVFNSEEVKLDALIAKGFLAASKTASEAEMKELIGEFPSIEKFAGYKLCKSTDKCHERSILISLLIFYIHNKKSFTFAHAQQIVEILNSKEKVFSIDITLPSVLIQQLSKDHSNIKSPGFSPEQLKLLSHKIEGVYYVGMCLANYLLADALFGYLITSFGLYLEAVKSDSKFIEELKHWNLENHSLIKILNNLENFLFGRTNAKAKSTLEESKYVYFLNSFSNNLKEIRGALKDYIGIEINHTSKSYFYESEFSEFWRNLSFPFQGITTTVLNSYPLQIYILNQLSKLSLEGQQKADIDAKIANFHFETPKSNNPYEVLIANKDNLQKLIVLLKQIYSLSVYEIEKKEWSDLENPANKKKKISFKLGKGTEVFMESVLKCLRPKEEEKTEHKKPEKPAEGITEKADDKAEAPTVCTTPREVPKYKELEFNPSCTKAREAIVEIFESKNQERRRPKVPKGVKDTDPAQMRVKNIVFGKIRKVFCQHGAVEIDTPVFELKETLLGKYGEEGGKLIYDLQDQGGELLSLRYDLTVPFARYLATSNLKKLKRFHIGKVYRRDQPDMSKGRFREFYQCDLDIAGAYDSNIVDAEALTILHEVMKALDVGDFEIKLCHRVLLEGIVLLSGAPLSKFKAICSAIDKLDKEPWEAVANELIHEKGIEKQAVEKIKTFVENRGKIDEMIAKVEQLGLFKGHEGSLKALEDLKLISKFLKIMKSYDNITLDLSLARGLDYYTGVIYEVVVHGSKVGSVGAGGRYDNLVGMFGSIDIPCVGLSIGIERIFVLLEEKMRKLNLPIRENDTQFLVATIGKDLIEQKLQLVSELWNLGFKAEVLYEAAPKPQKQLTFALESQIPFVIWLGDEEVKSGIVKIKCVYKKEETVVKRTELKQKCAELAAQYEKDLEEGKVIFEEEKKEEGDKGRGKKDEKKEEKKEDKPEKKEKKDGDKKEKKEGDKKKEEKPVEDKK